MSLFAIYLNSLQF